MACVCTEQNKSRVVLALSQSKLTVFSSVIYCRQHIFDILGRHDALCYPFVSLTALGISKNRSKSLYRISNRVFERYRRNALAKLSIFRFE